MPLAYSLWRSAACPGVPCHGASGSIFSLCAPVKRQPPPLKKRPRVVQGDWLDFVAQSQILAAQRTFGWPTGQGAHRVEPDLCWAVDCWQALPAGRGRGALQLVRHFIDVTALNPASAAQLLEPRTGRHCRPRSQGQWLQPGLAAKSRAAPTGRHWTCRPGPLRDAGMAQYRSRQDRAAPTMPTALCRPPAQAAVRHGCIAPAAHRRA